MNFGPKEETQKLLYLVGTVAGCVARVAQFPDTETSLSVNSFSCRARIRVLLNTYTQARTPKCHVHEHHC